MCVEKQSRAAFITTADGGSLVNRLYHSAFYRRRVWNTGNVKEV